MRIFVLGATGRTGREVVDLALARGHHEQVLNGKPAIVFRRDGTPSAALTLFVADGKIQSVFFHGDVARLGHL